MSSASTKARQWSPPEEIKVHVRKLTGTQLDELGVELETLPDGSLKITTPPKELHQIDCWNDLNPNQSIGVGDVITRVNGIGTDDPHRMRTMLRNEFTLRLTIRRDRRNTIRFFKFNDIDASYRNNHVRVPDLSADIRIVFPAEEYIGKYVGHGKSKTVFVIKRFGSTMAAH